MATVIDKLRVQGGAVPSSPATLSRASLTRRSNRKQASMKERGGHSRDLPQTASVNYGPTPIAKRMEYFSRLRQANIGLSSMDFANVKNEDEDGIKLGLVLTGKSVAPYEDVDRKMGARNQRWARPARAGSYKTTPRELYRVSHGISSKTGSEPSPFGHGIHAVFEPDAYNGLSLGNNDGSFVRSQVEGHDNVSLPSISAGTPAFSNGWIVPSTAPSLGTRTTDSLRSATLTSLELTGQRFSGMPSDDFCGHVEADVLDESNFPYLRTPRRKLKYSRLSNHLSGSEDLEKSLGLQKSLELQKCLKIRKTVLPITGKSKNYKEEPDQGDTNEKKRHHDSPPHSTRIGTADSDFKRYEFNTMDSYLNFNRHFKTEVQNSRFSQLPRGMVTLPAPWADDVLLKMVYDMNNPKSRKSSAKYSDIAVHADLDEFFVVRSPSALDKYGQSGNNIVVASAHRSPVLRRKSNKSVKSARTEDKIEEEEEDGEQDMRVEPEVVTWDTNHSTEEGLKGYDDDNHTMEYSNQNTEFVPESVLGDRVKQGQMDSSRYDPEAISVANDKMEDSIEMTKERVDQSEEEEQKEIKGEEGNIETNEVSLE